MLEDDAWALTKSKMASSITEWGETWQEREKAREDQAAYARQIAGIEDRKQARRESLESQEKKKTRSRRSIVDMATYKRLRIKGDE